MKKALAFLLTILMTVSALGVFAAAEFSDADKISVFDTEAVEILSDLKVVTGFPDGSFKPEETLTRAQAAKILCTLLLGTKKADALSASGSTFSDVPASHWANKFVEYCASKKVVSGVGGGKFNPDGKLTDLAFGKMLLVAIGADVGPLTGAEWQKNTYSQLAAKHLDYGVNLKGSDLTRQDACRLALNAMFVGEEDDPGEMLAYKSFKIVRKYRGYNYDLFARPIVRYLSQFENAHWPGTEKILTSSPDRVYANGPITGDAFVKLLGVKELKKSQMGVFRASVFWTSGKVPDIFKEGNQEIYFRSDNGIRLEFFYNHKKDEYTILHVPTFANKITAVTEPVKNADGSVKTPGSVTFDPCGTIPSNDYTAADVGKYGLFRGVSSNGWVNASKAVESVAPTYVTGKLEANEKGVSVTVDGKTYPYPYVELAAVTAEKYLEAGGKIGDTVNLVLDSYGCCYAIWK